MWNKTVDKLPEHKMLCECIAPSGDVIELYRQGNLWFNNGVYVYFTPIAWRYI